MLRKCPQCGTGNSHQKTKLVPSWGGTVVCQVCGLRFTPLPVNFDRMSPGPVRLAVVSRATPIRICPFCFQEETQRSGRHSCINRLAAL